MAKNDFDIDFDFEKEYGFDPKAILDSEYTDEDLDHFMQAFFTDCTACKHAVDNNSYAAPKPSYFNCNMCSFKTICSTYMYAPLNEAEVLEEFKEEFVKREEDHLNEKTERSGGETDA